MVISYSDCRVRPQPRPCPCPTMNNHLQADDRLAILRSEDQFRSWGSLDEKRFCNLCEKTFRGRHVQIRRRRGGYQLHCPTEGCNSRPDQWVYPGNFLISDSVDTDWWRALGEERKRSSVNKG